VGVLFAEGMSDYFSAATTASLVMPSSFITVLLMAGVRQINRKQESTRQELHYFLWHHCNHFFVFFLNIIRLLNH
jgi:hypothetical protein